MTPNPKAQPVSGRDDCAECAKLRAEIERQIPLGDVLTFSLVKDRVRQQYDRYPRPFNTALGDIRALIAIIERFISPTPPGERE